MVRTAVAINQKCKDCGTRLRECGPRCRACHNVWKAAKKRERAQRKNKELFTQNPMLAKTGKRICAKCFKVRWITEYGTSQPRRQGKMNKICDRCLSQIYGYRGQGLDYKYWRRRAYSVNCAARLRLAAQRAVSAKTLTFANLDYECKPLDLQAMYADDPLCRFCRVELTSDNLTVDHLHPASRGGASKLDNLVLCCSDCNHLKHTRTSDEFAKFIFEYAARLMKAAEQRDKQPAG